MKEYHKIQTVYKRNPEHKRELIAGEYSLPEFEFLANCRWVFTEKVDGTNIRVMFDGKSVVFGGKTDNAQIPVSLLYKLQELFEGTENIKRLKKVLPDGGCLYGEGYGNKIQKAGSKYIVDGVDFVLFDVKIGDWWLERENVLDIGSKLNIKTVPIIGSGTLLDMVRIVENGFDSVWGNFKAEGIVARPSTELFTRNGDRIITKVKCRDFKEE